MFCLHVSPSSSMKKIQNQNQFCFMFKNKFFYIHVNKTDKPQIVFFYLLKIDIFVDMYHR